MHSGLPPDDIAHLLVELAGRNRSAMRLLYEATSKRLFAIIMRVTRDRAAAEDILQETYIKVWNHAAGFDPRKSHPFAWLATIARNSAIDWRRSHYQRKVTPQDSFELMQDEAETADARIERQQVEAKVDNMLGELPQEREAEIRNAFFEGKSYADLAREADLPLGTIKSRIRRTLIQLRTKVGDD